MIVKHTAFVWEPAAAQALFRPTVFRKPALCHLIVVTMSAPANKRSRFTEGQESELVLRARGRMAIKFLAVLTNAVSQTILYQIGMRDPRKIVSQQVHRILQAISVNELEHLYDHLGEVIMERRMADELEQEMNRSTTSTSSFLLVEPEEEKRTPPLCHCGQTAVILQVHKQGPNHQRLFYRCHRWQETSKRCAFFQWLNKQPNWGEMSKRSSPMKSPPENAKEIFEKQINCKHHHPNLIGSNGFQIRINCADCQALLLKKERETGKVVWRREGYVEPIPSSASSMGSGKVASTGNKFDLIPESPPLSPKKPRAKKSGTTSKSKDGRVRGVPGVEEVQGLPEVEEQLVEEPTLDQWPRSRRAAPKRQLLSSLKRWEALWTDLAECLGEEAYESVERLRKRVLTDMQQPSKKRLAHYKEVFGLTAIQMRTVAEVYNPKVFTTKATKHRLISGKAFDLVLGDNLLSAGARRSVMNCLRHDRPGLVVVSPPCGPFSQLQNLSLDSRNKNPVRTQEYMKKLSEGKRLLQFACQVCELCSSLGLTFLFEHPWAAKSWQEKCLRRVKKLDGVCLVRGDQCQFGLRDRRGQPLRKATGFMTNCQALADRLARRCRQDHEHGHIIGTLDGYPKSKDAQYYPDGLVNAVLKEYARLVGRELLQVQMDHADYIIEQDDQLDRIYFTEKELQNNDYINDDGVNNINLLRRTTTSPQGELRPVHQG